MSDRIVFPDSSTADFRDMDFSSHGQVLNHEEDLLLRQVKTLKHSGMEVQEM